MIGALTGDLAAWTWEHDKDEFFSRLISMNSSPSSYGHAIMQAACKYIFRGQHTRVGLSDLEDMTRPEQRLMWHIVSAWTDGNGLDDVPEDRSTDETERYVSRIMVQFIQQLRKGVAKSEVFNSNRKFKDLTGSNLCNWNSDMPPGNNLLIYVFRAWNSFYRGFDYTSSLHNAMCWPGDKHLLGIMTGAFAEAMYGCDYFLLKRNCQKGSLFVSSQVSEILGKYCFQKGLIMEMCAVSRKGRDFYAKNEALTNVESHQWEEVVNIFSEIDFTEEEHRRIMKSAQTGWECRYGFYLDDGWHYIYRSGWLISRFKMKKIGSCWEITDWQLSGERSYKDSLTAFWCALYEGCRIRNSRINDLSCYALECKYFNGEEEVPSRWADTIQGKFWYGEKIFVTSGCKFKERCDHSESVLKGLGESERAYLEKYSKAQQMMLCYIGIIYRRWRPCSDMGWILDY